MTSLKNLVNMLKHLSKDKNDIRRRQYNSERVLQAIYLVSVDSELHVTEGDKVKTAHLIKEVVKDLDNCVFNLGNSFDQDRGSYYLILRSGVQFLLDDLKYWPVDCNTRLETYLTIFKEGDSLETFDEALEHWKEDPPTVSLESVYHTKQELKRPAKVPIYHTWWV